MRSRVRWNCICAALDQNPTTDVALMMYRPRKQTGPTIDDVAQSCVIITDVACFEADYWLVRWHGRWPCEMVVLVDDVAVQPCSVTGSLVKEHGMRMARLCAWAVLTSAVLARSGMQHVSSSPEFHQWIYCLPLHDGMFKNTFWKLWFLGLDQTPFFFKNKLYYQVLENSRNQTHTSLRGSATCLLHGTTDLY